VDLFSEFEQLQANLGENLEILNGTFSDAILNLRNKLSQYKDQKVNLEKKTTKIVKSVNTAKLQQQKKFKESKKVSKKSSEKVQQQENEITKVLISCKSSEENLRTNVMNLTKLERHLYLELLMSLKGILLMQKELFNLNECDMKINKINSILETNDEEIDIDNGKIVICKKKHNPLTIGSENLDSVSVKSSEPSNQDDCPQELKHFFNDRFSTSTMSYDGSDSGIYSDKTFDDSNDKSNQTETHQKYSTVRRSPSPYRSRNSLNIMKPIFCKPPVIDASKQLKKSCKQFAEENKRIKRNTIMASRKYEDEDDEVSFYMMNTMVGSKNIYYILIMIFFQNDLSNGNYVHFDNVEEDFIYDQHP